MRDHCRGLHSGQGVEALQHLFMERQARGRLRVLVVGQREIQRQQRLRRITLVYLHEPLKILDEQARADKKNQRERNASQ